MKKEKGVAGLAVLLSVITLIFVIGFLVMIFALMGGGLRDSATLTAGQSGSGTQDGVLLSETGVSLTSCANNAEGAVTTITVINASGGQTLTSTNYTTSACTFTGSGAGLYNGTTVNTTYSFTFAGEGYFVINDTVDGIANVTTWFPIIITITVMVVLILLTVIIISAIRSSGLLQAGGTA